MKARLFHWYIEEFKKDDDVYAVAWGNVQGHYRLADTTFIHTSVIKSVTVDEESEQVIIQTLNTEYLCPLNVCCYEKGDTSKFVENFETYREKFSNVMPKEYEVSSESVLLVFSDHERYYFETAFCKHKDECVKMSGGAHIGTFQDSFLIRHYAEKWEGSIDIRYFPHEGNLEFYMMSVPDNMDIYIENSGESELYFKAPGGTMKVGAGERKKVCNESLEPKESLPLLPGGDLYPAQFL